MAKVVSLEEFKHLLAAKKLVFGTDETLKLLHSGRLSKIFVSSNCDNIVKLSIERSGIECVVLSESSDEVGVVCKKPFSISVIGVLA